jgi:CDP-diacylglycerol--serine O-phosphatidyltransferase
LLISYPWEVLSAGAVLYLACLPLGWLSYRDYQRKDAQAAAGAATSPVSTDASPLAEPGPTPGPEGDRPARLN